jgi:hypothetical protein
MKTIKLPRLHRLHFITIFVVPVVCSFVFSEENCILEFLKK